MERLAKMASNSTSSFTPPQSSNSSTSSMSRSSWSTFSRLSSEPRLRVAVIGGGLGGLTLGQLLSEAPNIDVTVYEKSVDSVDRLCGYRVMLSYFVLQNLQATLRREVWNRVAASIGAQPQGGQELRFMKRCIHLIDSLIYNSNTV